MISTVDYNSISSVWHQNKWKGQFKVKWLYVKDVPNLSLRHIRLENNENKSVTNSRDVQEVPNPKGQQVVEIIHSFQHVTCIFDDFTHYEKRQLEEHTKKVERVISAPPAGRPSHYNDRPPYHGGAGGGGSSGSGGGGGGGGSGGGGGYENRQSGFDNRRREGNNYGKTMASIRSCFFYCPSLDYYLILLFVYE